MYACSSVGASFYSNTRTVRKTKGLYPHNRDVKSGAQDPVLLALPPVSQTAKVAKLCSCSNVQLSLSSIV